MQMRTLFVILSFAIVLIAAAGCDKAHQAAAEHAEAAHDALEGVHVPEGDPTVSATVDAKSGSTLTGSAEFYENDGMIILVLKVQNAPPGVHAVHLHDVGDCSADDGTSAGGHWNPTAVDHGAWGGEAFHLGDIGNFEVDETGAAEHTFNTDLWSIGSGDANDIVGRAIIIHEKQDDLTSQPTGAAGGRIGCGVVG